MWPGQTFAINKSAIVADIPALPNARDALSVAADGSIIGPSTALAIPGQHEGTIVCPFPVDDTVFAEAYELHGSDNNAITPPVCVKPLCAVELCILLCQSVDASHFRRSFIYYS